MKSYYIDIEKSIFNENEVHEKGCHRMPKQENLEFLGNYSSCHTALKEAQKKFNDATGCYSCSWECS